MATTNFENDALTLYRTQNCIRRSFTFSRPHRVWTSDVTETLTNTQLAAHRQLVADIVNDMSPHQRRYKTCSCGSSDILRLWPRDILCPTLARPAESDARDMELDVATDRLAYVIAINPPEDRPALLHDLVYRAMRSRLLVDNKTWPWTTAVDLWACESHLAQRFGFDTFPGAVFAAHMIWPTEQCKRALNITSLPDTDLGPTKYWERQHRIAEGYSAAFTEISDGMEAAILEDNTQHHCEPDYGCTCLAPSSYDGSLVAECSGGNVSSTSRSSNDHVSPRLTSLPDVR